MLFKSYKPNKTVISFELFPPRTAEGVNTLKDRLPYLANLNPDFITVTYGAMGATQANTLEIATYVKKVLNIDVAHHLTCVGATSQHISNVMNAMRENNITSVVDYGCGDLGLYNNFSWTNIDYLGIDVSSEAIRLAKLLYKQKVKLLCQVTLSRYF